MSQTRLSRILKDYAYPLLLPGLAVAAFFVILVFLPFGGFDSGRRISQVIINLVDSAMVISLVLIFAFSMRYFRARGFYFLLLLIVQLWFLQQGASNPDGVFWTLIYVPMSFTLFLLVSERGLFSPRTRLLLIIIGLPVLLRFLLEKYLQLPLTDFAQFFPFREYLTAGYEHFSFWSLLFYLAAGTIAIIRYIVNPNRDLAAVIWLILISVAMVFVASAKQYPSVVQAGLGSNQLTPEYMFLAGAGVEPGLHAFLGLLVFAASLIEVFTLFDISYRMAYMDQLTGLPGRRAFDEAMKNMGRKYAIAMVDIDHFKGFNDNYGHDVGDQVLKMVGHLLKNNARPGTAYRYGGEEFVIVYPASEIVEVMEPAEGLRKKIGDYPFALRKFLRPHYAPGGMPAEKTPTSTGKGGSRKSGSSSGSPGKKVKKKDIPRTLKITVSMGLSDHSDQELHPADVLKKADEALYTAKDKGRNRMEVQY